MPSRYDESRGSWVTRVTGRKRDKPRAETSPRARKSAAIWGCLVRWSHRCGLRGVDVYVWEVQPRGL